MTPKAAFDALEKELGAKLKEAAVVERCALHLLNLHHALGGGLPYGRTVLLYGPSDSGKTTLALELCASVLDDSQDRVLYVDHEFAVDLEYAERITKHGSVAYCTTIKQLRTAWNKGTRLLVFRPSSFETAKKVVDTMMGTGEVAMVVHDSVASMDSEDDSDDPSGMPTIPKKLAKWLPRHKKRAAAAGCISLFINHAKKKTIGYVGAEQYRPWTQPGGRAVQFYSDLWLFATGRKDKLNENGRSMRVTVKRNKSHTKRGMDVNFKINGLDGVDRGEASLEYAIAIGLVTKNSSGKYLPQRSKTGKAVMKKTVLRALADPKSIINKAVARSLKATTTTD